MTQNIQSFDDAVTKFDCTMLNN